MGKSFFAKERLNIVLSDLIANGDLGGVEKLIADGVNVSFENDRAFLTAVRLKFFDIAEVLLDAGANVNAGFGQALIMAVKADEADAVDFLVGHGATPFLIKEENISEDMTVLRGLVRSQKMNVYDYLLELVNEKFPEASSSGQIEILSVIAKISEMPFVKEKAKEFGLITVSTPELLKQSQIIDSDQQASTKPLLG